MSVRTNELQKITDVTSADSFIIDSETEGTARLTLEAATEFLRGSFMSNGVGGVPYGKELSESWADLSARIKKGNFDGIHIGDYKTINLTTNEQVVMEVAGIDQYYNCGDTAIGHHVDFISRDALKGAKQWNTEANNNSKVEATKSPWLTSALYKALNETVYGTLPADLKPYIIEKRALLEERYSAAGSATADTGWSWQNAGKLWLPTEVEVFGCVHWSNAGFGSGGGGCNLQYPIFIGGSKHLIKGDGKGGSRCPWWELSVHSGSATNVCYVSHYGNAGYLSAAGTNIRAPLCFRIG